MLLDFSVENYRSFRERATFSMIPDGGKQERPGNIATINGKYKALTAAVVLGANASGKSNLMRAFRALRGMVLSSAEQDPAQSFSEYDPFRFCVDHTRDPVQFEINFLLGKTRYRYALSFLQKIVVSEQLFFYPAGREARLFGRNFQQFEFGDYLKGPKAAVAELTAPNQLFLSKAAKNNVEQLAEVFIFFNDDLMAVPVLDDWRDRQYVNRIAKELAQGAESSAFHQNFKALLLSFDTGIADFRVVRDAASAAENFRVEFLHPVFNDSGQNAGAVFQDMEEESAGTQKLFVLGGLMLRALMNGRTIFIDEFERSLHPLIATHILQIFQNPKINDRGAQLVIATHDTNLLDTPVLRRDQIWMVEKNDRGESALFSLADVRGIRPDIPYEKWYLSGRFGGVPGIEKLNLELNFAHEAA